MKVIKNLEDPFVRESLWKVYNKRCFYCKDPILYKNMQVDHVIPIALGEKKAIIEYSLNSGFNLNSYNNLVPSCASCNNAKRAKAYEKTRMLFLLELIEPKIPKIEEYERNLRDKDSDSELTLNIKKAIDEDKVYELIKLLNDNELTSVEHNTLNETLKKIRPISTLTPLENRRIQEFIDEVNRILADFSIFQLFFNKQRNRFVNNKAGIVIVNEFGGAVTYSLFAVSNIEVNIIREIRMNQWRSLASKGVFKYRTTDFANYIIQFPVKSARNHIFSYFANLLSLNALYKSKNNLLAIEFIVDFIDKYRYQLGLQIKEEYSLDELIDSIQIHLPLWIDEALKFVDRKTINRLVQSRGYVTLGFIDFLISSFREKIEKCVQNRIRQLITPLNLSQYTLKLPIITEELPFHAFKEFVFNFKNNKIKEIKRIYNTPDFNRNEFKKSSRISNAYSDDKIMKNIRFVYENLVDVYSDVVSKVFPQIKNELIPCWDCSKIIVEVEKEKDCIDSFSPFSRNQYWLNGEEEKEEFELIFYDHPAEIISQELRESRKWVNELIKFNDKNYKIHQISSGVLDFVYHKLPLFNNVKELLIDKFSKLLEENHIEILSKIL